MNKKDPATGAAKSMWLADWLVGQLDEKVSRELADAAGHADANREWQIVSYTLEEQFLGMAAKYSRKVNLASFSVIAEPGSAG